MKSKFGPTSIRIEPTIWKEFKILCIKKDMEISKYLIKIIKKELKENAK